MTPPIGLEPLDCAAIFRADPIAALGVAGMAEHGTDYTHGHAGDSQCCDRIGAEYSGAI